LQKERSPASMRLMPPGGAIRASRPRRAPPGGP
jgi:hypothetical protein